MCSAINPAWWSVDHSLAHRSIDRLDSVNETTHLVAELLGSRLHGLRDGGLLLVGGCGRGRGGGFGGRRHLGTTGLGDLLVSEVCESGASSNFERERAK